MNAAKQQYLKRIRSETSYPTYRGIIGLIALLGYGLAALIALVAVVASFGSMGASFPRGVVFLVGGLIVSALVFLGARFFKEGSLILADIGDSTTEANQRTAEEVSR